MVNQLTKMARFLPTQKSVMVSQLAHQFVDQLFCLYGLQVDIVNDRDSKFTSEFCTLVFNKFEEENEVKKVVDEYLNKGLIFS